MTQDDAGESARTADCAAQGRCNEERRGG